MSLGIEQLIKTPFFGRRYLHLLISYTILSKKCFFFVLSDCKMINLKDQRIAVKFCVLIILDKKFSRLAF